MTEEEKVNISEAISEVKNASEDDLRKVIEKWFESTRTQGMKLGASYISAAVYSTIQKHLKKGAQSSLRDYKRAVDDIIKIVSVQLAQQNTRQNDSQNNEENNLEDHKEEDT